MSILFYKKPDYINKVGGPLTKSNCQKYVDRAACSKSQIPAELSFENVMSGKTLPPCSIPDFLDYLIYIAHDAENLQFWLWLQDYTKRFEALPTKTRQLSALVKPEDGSTETLVLDRRLQQEDDDKTLDFMSSASYHRAAAENERFANQPFRREISQITAHYILPGSPRELNISHRDRSALLSFLAKTTHPSAFDQIKELTTLALKNHSHPNFVRWSICNGNKPRTLFLRTFAAWMLAIGIILSLLLILSDKSRWIRIVVWLPIWIGTITVVASSRGLCVLLFRRSTREEHPWEIGRPIISRQTGKKNHVHDQDKQQLVVKIGQMSSPKSDDASTGPDKEEAGLDLEALSVLSGRTLNVKMEPFGPTNAWDNEPWTTKWQNMPWIRKLRLREVWVKEEGLKFLQNRIVLQAHLWGLIIAIPYTIAIVACPQVGLY